MPLDDNDWRRTVPYRPSSGTEGADFEARFCDRCTRDAKYRRTQNGEDGCPILAAVSIYEIDDPKYPKEWVKDAGDVYGATARCTNFRDGQMRRGPRKPNPAPLLDLLAAS